MQKRISVEFVMVMEIPAEPIADSMRRRAMVSWLCVVLLSKLLDVTTEVKYIYIYIYISGSCKVARLNPSEVYV